MTEDNQMFKLNDFLNQFENCDYISVSFSFISNAQTEEIQLHVENSYIYAKIPSHFESITDEFTTMLSRKKQLNNIIGGPELIHGNSVEITVETVHSHSDSEPETRLLEKNSGKWYEEDNRGVLQVRDFLTKIDEKIN